MKREIFGHDCEYVMNLSKDNSEIKIKCTCGTFQEKAYKINSEILTLFDIEKISGKCDQYADCGDSAYHCFKCKKDLCESCAKGHKDHLLSNINFFKYSSNQDNVDLNEEKEKALKEKLTALSQAMEKEFIAGYNKMINTLENKKQELKAIYESASQSNSAVLDIMGIMYNKFKKTNDNYIYEKFNQIFSNINKIENCPDVTGDIISKKKWEDFKNYFQNFNLIKPLNNKLIYRLENKNINNSVNSFTIIENASLYNPIILACDTGLYVTKFEKDHGGMKYSRVDTNKEKKSYKIVKKGFTDRDVTFFFVAGDQFLDTYKCISVNANLSFSKIMSINFNKGKLKGLFTFNEAPIIAYYTDNNLSFYNYSNEEEKNEGINVDKNIEYCTNNLFNSNLVSCIKLTKENNDDGQAQFLIAEKNKLLTLLSYSMNGSTSHIQQSFEKECITKESLYQIKNDTVLLGFSGGVSVLKIMRTNNKFAESQFEFTYDDQFRCFTNIDQDFILCGLKERGVIQLKINTDEQGHVILTKSKEYFNVHKNIKEIYYFDNILFLVGEDKNAYRYALK